MSALPPDLADIRARLSRERGARLWRSLEEIADAPEVRRHLEAEFPDVMRAGAIDRRTLLRLISASLALGGLVACDNFGAPLTSQARGTPGYTPGEPIYFATSLELGGYGRGALVRVQEGRPNKIDGNPLHPATLGATDVFLQAEVLSLFDPDLAQLPLEGGDIRTLSAFADAFGHMRAILEPVRGRGLHVLLQPVASPTIERLVATVRKRLPEVRFYSYAPIGDDTRIAGAVAAFGRRVDVVYDLSQADTVVTLGGDLFLYEPGHIRYAADFQKRRREKTRDLPRLVAVETNLSLVGSRADERIPRRPSGIEAFARALASAFGIGAPGADPAAARIAALLRQAGPRALVAVGREQPAVVHALAHAINNRLGAFGTTLRAIEPVRRLGAGTIDELANALARGEATHLLILDGNPAYDAPADLDISPLITRVPWSVHLGRTRDETAVLCRWHVPLSHPLQSWGDLRAFDGTAGIRQPTSVSRRESRSVEETLGVLAGLPPDGRALVQGTWREIWREIRADAFDARWAEVLEVGVIPDTTPPASVEIMPGFTPPAAPDQSAPAGFEILFSPDPTLWDGRYANNAWLQETPKPHTKQVWGNAALIAPDTAGALKLASGDTVDIVVAGRTLRAPVLVLPGHAQDTITLTLGYGRSQAAEIARDVGVNAYRLRTLAALWSAPAAIAPAGGHVPLISTQHHFALEGRDLVRVVSPEAPAAPGPEPRPSLYPEWQYEGHAWGMAIDLDACIGCNACVVACQAENNVPVVGPEQVALGREMHWLRVDRYYSGDPAHPETYFQPVPCMHCEKAPCEVVCPVNATVHSEDGLNLMVYNRCIGTRSCSNNCPYKVRRFNFLEYRTAGLGAEVEGLNPQVTVRERGVMEKCTFCVQRIAAARISAHAENRPIRDGEVTTACAEACPTRAIVFGDINDRASDVMRLKQTPRNYALLGELNTQPRTTYLARIVRREPAEE